MEPDVSVEFAGLTLGNPIIAASGATETVERMARLEESEVGAARMTLPPRMNGDFQRVSHSALFGV